MSYLVVDDIQTYYGNIQALKSISRGGGGRVRDADRLQRGWQVDHAAPISGLTPARCGSYPLPRR